MQVGLNVDGLNLLYNNSLLRRASRRSLNLEDKGVNMLVTNR